MFWGLAFGMVVLAVALVVWPLYVVHGRRGPQREAINVVLYRDRLVELAVERDSGALSAEQFVQAQVELQRDLLENGAPEAAAVARQRQPRTALLLVVVLPLLSGGIYWWLGAPDFIALEPVPAQQAASDAGGMEDALQKLRARLAVTPADLDGWMLLGRTLMVQQQYTAAADTFAQAQRHVGERADLLAAQAEALSMTQEQVGGRSQQLAMRALELDPDNHLALWLSGYAAYGQGDSTSAVRHWERLMALLPAQNPMTQLVLDGLAQARGKPDATPTASPTTEMAEEVALQISVRLDESLLAEVAAGDVLFVYALDPAGGRMPIASVRRDATFPTQVTLDGTSVLLRDRQLADFPALKIVARVSRSGEATTRSGDLYAEAVIRPREGGSLSLVIDRQVP